MVRGAGRRGRGRLGVLRGHRERLDEPAPRVRPGRREGDRRRTRGRPCSTRRPPPQTVHMILAAFMVAGFGARQRLRGRDAARPPGPLPPAGVPDPVRRRRRHHPGADRCRGLGGALRRRLPAHQAGRDGGRVPHRHAASRCTSAASPCDGQLRYAIEIPTGCPCCAHWDPDAEVQGLDEVPPADRPPVNIVHLAFQTHGRASASGCSALGAWFAWRGGGAGTCRDPRGSCAPRPCPGWPRSSRWRRLGHHRGRPPALDRLRPCCAPRRGEHRARPVDRAARGRRRLRRADRRHRVRAAPAGTRHPVPVAPQESDVETRSTGVA